MQLDLLEKSSWAVCFWWYNSSKNGGNEHFTL